MLQENGKVKPEKKRKIRPIKCKNCKSKIDIEYALKSEDYDLVNKGQYVFYCSVCGESTDIIKL